METKNLQLCNVETEDGVKIFQITFCISEDDQDELCDAKVNSFEFLFPKFETIKIAQQSKKLFMYPDGDYSHRIEMSKDALLKCLKF